MPAQATIKFLVRPKDRFPLRVETSQYIIDVWRLRFILMETMQ